MTIVNAWIDDDTRRIAIQNGFTHGGSVDVETIGFIKAELPGNRWNSQQKLWTCQATPAAAAKIIDVAEAAEPGVTELAKWWPVRMDQPSVWKGNVNDLSDATLAKLWGHQWKTIHFANKRKASLLALDMGTGKSLIALCLLHGWRSGRSLVICPHSVMDVWPAEIKKHGFDFRSIVLDRGTMAKKVAMLEANLLVTTPTIVIVNYESAWRGELGKYLLDRQWDAVVLDESHRIKSASGKASRFCGRLGRQAARRLALTGTPLPHSPLDIWAQARFLDAGQFKASYSSFRHEYAVMDTKFPSRVFHYKDQDRLNAEIAKIAIRFRTEDVLDLPPKVTIQRPFSLSAEARRVYDEFEENLIAEFRGVEFAADNALVVLLRLQQITGGYVQAEPGDTPMRIDHGKERQLADILEDLDKSEPVVVFCRFRHDLEVVHSVCSGTARKSYELSGSRKDLKLWQERAVDTGAVLAVQVQSGGVGIDLTAAHHLVFFSQTWSLGDNDQCIAREHRPGQTHAVRIYRLVAKGTVDETIARAIEARRKVVEYVLQDLGIEVDVH